MVCSGRTGWPSTCEASTAAGTINALARGWQAATSKSTRSLVTNSRATAATAAATARTLGASRDVDLASIAAAPDIGAARSAAIATIATNALADIAGLDERTA